MESNTGRAIRMGCLVAPSAEDAKAYDVRTAEGRPVVMFVTGGINDKTSDETAIANLSHLSETLDQGTLVLSESVSAVWFQPVREIARATYGCVTETVTT